MGPGPQEEEARHRLTRRGRCEDGGGDGRAAATHQGTKDRWLLPEAWRDKEGSSPAGFPRAAVLTP